MSNMQIQAISQKSPESKDVFTVLVSRHFLSKHDFIPGSYVAFKTPSGSRRVVRLRVDNAMKESANLVRMTQRALNLYDLKPNDTLSICPPALRLASAQKVLISRTGDIPESANWDAGRVVARLKTELLNLAFVSVGLTFELEDGHDKSRFYIRQINNSDVCDTFSIEKQTTVECLTGSAGDPILDLDFSSSGIGGLWEPQTRLRDLLVEYESPGLLPRGRKRGILLHGVSGTGKSLLLDRLSGAGWRSKALFDNDVNKESLSSAFTNALDHQPAIIVIHDLTAFDGGAGSNAAPSMSRFLRAQFGRIETARVLVVAACRSVMDIDQDLRHIQYFGQELEISVPDSTARMEIFSINAALREEDSIAVVERVAAQTHGYVGSDLVRLLDIAMTAARKRIYPPSTTTKEDRRSLINASQLVDEDFQLALSRVRPTALREIFVETPHVAWTDVAGQDDVKQYLEQAIMWPYRYSDLLKICGVRPSNGLLLYGPPGCSKTMIAKAAATESGLNFIAVSGAELLNMYVGETERAIRNLFAKARAASPCIIFFDEMEAIATSRNHSSSSNSAVYSVTTLLSEMDGITGSKGLFMLGATNQPEMIDFALLRPGRFDRTLYVGAPDEKARLQILSKETSHMPLDTVHLDAIAREADGMSGAEMVELCQAASRSALKRAIETSSPPRITSSDFDYALHVATRSITEEMESRYASFARKMRGDAAAEANNAGLGTEL